MRLYHTGYAPIPAPDLRRGRRNADFGQGFYCADTDAFAGKWARERRGERVYVNAYELDETGLAILRLERDEEWYRIVFSNRAGRGDLTAGADAERLLEEGTADLIGVGRALLQDEDWSVKALEEI